MQFQPNWPRIKQRMEALWEGEILDNRAMFYVMAPRDNAVRRPVATPPVNDPLAWYAAYIDRQVADMEVTYLGGDALPVMDLSPGEYSLGKLIGARYHVLNGVNWPEHGTEDLETIVAQLRIHWDGEYWKLLEQFMRIAARAAKDKCLITLPANCLQGLDTLAVFRPTDQLLVDLLERPEIVKHALHRLDAIWAVTYETMWRTFRAQDVELTDMLPLWSPQRFGVLQSDISVMLSPPMFREFVMPGLVHCMAFLDRAMFHFDGAEMLQHLDALLGIKTLHAVQFQQGNAWNEAASSALPFIPVLKKIQAAGKCAYIACVPEEVEPLMRELSSRRLFIATATRTEAEARDLEKLVAKLTHD